MTPGIASPLVADYIEGDDPCLEFALAALVAKDFKWATQEVETVCPYCGVGCGIYLGIDKGAIVSVRGNDQSPVNNGRG
jgi:predicted molibdopterin-dependent oxidoreductase YjgC